MAIVIGATGHRRWSLLVPFKTGAIKWRCRGQDSIKRKGRHSRKWRHWRQWWQWLGLVFGLGLVPLSPLAPLLPLFSLAPMTPSAIYLQFVLPSPIMPLVPMDLCIVTIKKLLSTLVIQWWLGALLMHPIYHFSKTWLAFDSRLNNHAGQLSNLARPKICPRTENFCLLKNKREAFGQTC